MSAMDRPLLSLQGKVLATLALAVLAVFGNYLSLPLFFGVHFIFGSIAVMVAVLLLGTVPAVLVAIAGGAYTLVLWGHPYALVIFTVEALVAGLIYQRGLRNLVMADLIYWVVLGIPLVLLFYRGLLDMAWEPASMIALKQSINALFNTLIAGILVIVWQLTMHGRFSLPGKPALAVLLFHTILTVTLLAGVVPIIHESRTQSTNQEAFMHERLHERASELVERLLSDQQQGRERYDYHLERVQSRDDMGLAILSAGGSIIAGRGEIQALTDTGRSERLAEGFSVWLPDGQMSAVQRWQRGRYVLTLPLSGIPELARVMVELPAAKLVGTLERQRLELFVMLAMMVALAVVSAAWLSHAISRPLRDLEAVSDGMAEQIANGQRPRLPTSQVYEYGSMGNSLRDMAHRLTDSFDALHHARETLEEQVRQRTLELSMSTELLSNVLEAAQDFAIIATDQDGTITLFNPGAEQLLGYAAEEVVGRETPLLFHLPEEVAERAAELHVALGRTFEGFEVFTARASTENSAHQEWGYRRKDGSIVPVSMVVTTMCDDAGKISGYLGIAEDITERRAMMLALQEQANHTQTILDNMVDGIITIDANGIIQSFSPAATRIFAYSVEEVLGKNVSMLMPSPHHEAHDSYLRNYQATGVARIIGIGREVEGKRKDGSLFPMELAVSAITQHGQPLYVGMVRDISERKRMERMKSEFVSTVSHELRTPLTSISGALGLVVGGAVGELPEQVRQMIGIAYKNSQRLTYLINDLLDMEKIAAGKLRFEMQRQPLLPLLEQALEANQPFAQEHQVGLAFEGSRAEIPVWVDGQRLLQVLANLLSNAIKFSPPGETVVLSLQPSHSIARITVHDKGPGIPQEFRNRIFQKFSQADASDTRAKGGTGLGLAITRELVERMGGAIGFDSVEGEGASFWLELPILERESMPEEALPEMLTVPRVLVVEDDPDVARILCMLLERAGYRVELAETGEQALTALQEHTFAAITLDLMLPDINGLEIVRRLRQRAETLHLPIVVVSAKMEEGRLAMNGDFSDIEWLAKPIDDRHLLSVLDRVIEQAHLATPRVLHVEDDEDLHQVVRSMVGGRFEFELATTLEEAIALITLERFDVVILDIGLPDGSGWELLSEIRTRQPEARIIILSGVEVSPEQARKVEHVLLKSQVSAQQLLDALNNRIGTTWKKEIDND